MSTAAERNSGVALSIVILRGCEALAHGVGIVQRFTLILALSLKVEGKGSQALSGAKNL